MDTNSQYYAKYLKYKTKYMELQKLLGGAKNQLNKMKDTDRLVVINSKNDYIKFYILWKDIKQYIDESYLTNRDNIVPLSGKEKYQLKLENDKYENIYNTIKQNNPNAFL